MSTHHITSDQCYTNSPLTTYPIFIAIPSAYSVVSGLTRCSYNSVGHSRFDVIISYHRRSTCVGVLQQSTVSFIDAHIPSIVMIILAKQHASQTYFSPTNGKSLFYTPNPCSIATYPEEHIHILSTCHPLIFITTYSVLLVHLAHHLIITYHNTHHHYVHGPQSIKHACPEIEQMFHPYSISYLILPLLHEVQSNNISSGR
eukprot:190616_1